MEQSQETKNNLADSMAFAFYSKKILQERENYLQLHIKIRPWYMPKFIYQQLLNILFEMSLFKKY